jgi:predicted acylesterase/phospholipase RssA
MEITHIIAIIGSIVGVLGVFFKREEILSLRGKDFTARLDSTVRFFKDFTTQMKKSLYLIVLHKNLLDRTLLISDLFS